MECARKNVSLSLSVLQQSLVCLFTLMGPGTDRVVAAEARSANARRASLPNPLLGAQFGINEVAINIGLPVLVFVL